MLPGPVPPSLVSARVTLPLTVPAWPVGRVSARDVASLPPAAMSPVGPVVAVLNGPVAPASVAIRFSEYPSAGSVLLTTSASVPGSPTCRIVCASVTPAWAGR